MSTAIISAVLIVIVFIGIRSFVKRAVHDYCGGSNIKRIKTDKNSSRYTYQYRIYIVGMHCNDCKATVENALNALRNIYAEVDLKNKYAVIYSKEKCELSKLVKMIESCGFTVPQANMMQISA